MTTRDSAAPGLPADGSGGVIHDQPRGGECPYLAIVICNKCGWADPDKDRVGAAEARLAERRAALEPRTWVLAMPAGMELLNANDRGHWARRHRLTAGLRETAGWLAKAQRIPRIERARIAVEYQPPRTGRHRDGGNWAPSGKAVIDGIRDAGVFADDDSRHVLSETYSIGEPYPRGRIVVTITEVTAGPAGTGGGE